MDPYRARSAPTEAFEGLLAGLEARLDAVRTALPADWLRRRWSERWRARVPGCDPERAVALLRPAVALSLAAVNATFVAGIEPSERSFHAADVTPYLARRRPKQTACRPRGADSVSERGDE